MEQARTGRLARVAAGSKPRPEVQAVPPRDVKTTPHRTHFTHANIFSRVVQGPHLFLRRSCSMRSHCCLTSRLFHFHTALLLYSFPRTVVPTAIHTLEDRLVDWLNKVFLQLRIRWNFPKRRTGVSYATTQFRPSSSPRSLTIKMDQKGS